MNLQNQQPVYLLQLVDIGNGQSGNSHGNGNNNVVNINGTLPANYTLPSAYKNFLAGSNDYSQYLPSLQNLVDIGNG